MVVVVPEETRNPRGAFGYTLKVVGKLGGALVDGLGVIRGMGQCEGKLWLRIVVAPAGGS